MSKKSIEIDFKQYKITVSVYFVFIECLHYTRNLDKRQPLYIVKGGGTCTSGMKQ